jgi:hypothetical protein
LVCCPEKKALLKDRPALKHKRLFVWIWDTKEHKYLSDCQNNIASKNTALSKKQRESLNLKKVSSFQSQITNDEKKIIKKIIIKFLK